MDDRSLSPADRSPLLALGRGDQTERQTNRARSPDRAERSWAHVARFAPAACLLAACLLCACSPPPPAPEGLDAATSYLMREFYSSDAMFEAGLRGYVNWFEEEGYLLAGTRATVENTDAFTVGDLSDEDIDQLPVLSDRNIADTAGVVSLAEMECTVSETEALLVRADQYNVFSGDWTDYDRTFSTPRALWEEGTRSGEFEPVLEDLEPYGDEPDDLAGWATTFMQTANRVDPEPTLGGLADLNAYDLFLDFRHGRYDLGGEELQVFAILTYQVDVLPNTSGDGHLYQTYALEVNVQRPGDLTLRMMAVWTELDGAGLTADSAMTLNYSVNKALASAERISGICAGEILIPPEP